MSQQQLQSQLDGLLARLDLCTRAFAVHEGRYNQLIDTKISLEEAILHCKSLDLSYQKLQKFFQAMGVSDQERLQRWFEQVVTYGLQHVFGDAYKFVIIGPEIRNSEIAIRFAIMKMSNGALQERDPYSEMGGGIADVLSFLLQFVLVFLLRDRINPILFLDEPMKHLSVEYRPAMANLLHELTDKTGVQLVLITHEPLFAEVADMVYEFSHDGKETKIERRS